MRTKLIAEMKLEIKEKLKDFLCGEGIELLVASNDNAAKGNPLVELEAIDDIVLSGSKLLCEIRVVLKLLGKLWQCDSLIRGVYYILHPHNLTVSELSILLMSIHVEDVECEDGNMQMSRAVMRYIVEGVACEHTGEKKNRIMHYIVEEC